MTNRRWIAVVLAVLMAIAHTLPVFAYDATVHTPRPAGSGRREALFPVKGGAVKAAQAVISETCDGDAADDGTPTGQDVVDYALQFLGNPYVYGGSSLTDGVDCSGFVQQVYLHFGYELSHSTYTQIDEGTGVTYEEAQPGDLILYNGHVALYMGDHKIVHASDWSTGIVVGENAEQWPIIAVRRIIS